MEKYSEKWTKSTVRTALLTVVHPETAAVDVHPNEMWGAIRPDHPSGKTVRRFGAVTYDLRQLVKWFKDSGVTTVAMEATGVYWLPLYELLEVEGIRVCLVNARHVKNVPGRPKTDVRDCQWLQKLHASGLLTASFIPDASTRQLRGLLRHRDRLTRLQSQHILRMQKALREMNVHLDAVVTDIMGVTGLRILKALMQGRRDFDVIAQECRHPLIKATPEQIAVAIDGTYTLDSMFVLGQELEAYDFTGTQVAKLDVQLEQLLQLATAGQPAIALPDQGLTGREKRQGDAPAFNVQQYLYQITGVDLTRIPGIGANASLILLSEIGNDMSRWRSSDAFCSWLGVCPNLQKSAGKIHGSRPRRTCSHAKHILRLCASSLKNHHGHLGAFFRRIRARSGSPAAITATAHKLARIIFAMLGGKKAYSELGEDYYDKRYRERILRNMKRKAQLYGFQLVPLEQAS